MDNTSALVPVKDIKGVVPEVEDLHSWLVGMIGNLENATFEIVDETVWKSYQIREASTHLLCIALAHAKDRWDRGQVTLTEMGKYEHDFYVYVNTRTGKSYAATTIDNLIDVGRTFFIDVPENVVFPKDISLHNAGGTPTGEVIKYDPLQIPVSKLVHAKAALKRGVFNNNDTLWGQMFNPKVGVSVFCDILRNTKHPLVYDASKVNLLPPSELRIVIEGPYMLVLNGTGDAEVLGELEWDNIQSSDNVRKALQMIVDACGIKGWP